MTIAADESGPQASALKESPLLRSGASFLVGSVGLNASNFVFHAVMSRMLGPASYGALGSILTLLVVLAVPLGALQAAVTHGAASCLARSEKPDLLRVIKRSSALSLVATLGLLAWALPMSHYLNLKSAIPMLAVGLWVPATVIGSVMQGYLLGVRRFRAVAAVQFVGGGVLRLLSGVALVLLGAGLTGAVLASGISAVLSLLLLAFYLRNDLVPGGTPALQRDEAVQSLVALGGAIVLTSLDTWLARHFLAAKAAGYFAAATTAGRIPVFLTGALVLVAFPYFSAERGRTPRAFRLLWRTFALIAGISVVAVAIMAAFPQLIVSVLFGSGYSNSDSLLGVVALADAMVGVITLFVYFHLARKSAVSMLSWAGCVAAFIAASIFHSSALALAIDMLVVNGAVAVGLALLTTRTSHLRFVESRAGGGRNPLRPSFTDGAGAVEEGRLVGEGFFALLSERLELARQASAVGLLDWRRRSASILNSRAVPAGDASLVGRGLWLTRIKSLGIWAWPAIVLWVPVAFGRGMIWTRDPAFFATSSGNTTWFIGAVSSQTAISNISNQSLFYLPYGVVDKVFGVVGIPAQRTTFVVSCALSAVGLWGFKRLLEEAGISQIATAIACGFFLLNPWALDEFGYVFTWSGYCLLPVTALAVRQISKTGHIPPWLALDLLFTGGLIAWVVTAIFLLIGSAWLYIRRVPKRLIGAVGLTFLGAGAYWLLPYADWALNASSETYRTFAQQSSGLLQSPSPLTDLLRLRDFWWPHLLPAEAVGSTWAAVSGGMTIALVLVVLAWCVFAVVGTRPRGLFAVTAVFALPLGFVLGAGGAGPTGAVYRAVHSWPLPGHALIGGLTRDPANFLGIFVFALAILVGVAVDSVRGRRWMSNWALPGVAALLVVIIASPSLISFWSLYRPQPVPGYYAAMSRAVAGQRSLEVALWSDAAIGPRSGVAHFDWNRRIAADPTLLASYVNGTNISALGGPAITFDQEIVSQALSPGGPRLVVAEVHSLGLSALVVEDDIRLGVSDPLPRFIEEMTSVAERTEHFGPLTVIELGATDHAVCSVSSAAASFGAGRVSCPGRRGGRLVSPEPIAGPLMGWGLETGRERSVLAGLGTELPVAGHGWLISVPAALASLGALLSIVTVLVLYRLRLKAVYVLASRRFRSS